MIRVMIDSGTDQNKWMRENYDYGFIPLSVIMDDKAYLDEREITLPEVYNYMKEGNFPKTSQITPNIAEEVFEEARQNGEDIIYITLFKEVSGTYQVAYNVMNDFKEKYPEMKIAVIDSTGGAGGGAVLALQALEMVKHGYTFEEIVKQTEWSAEQMEYYFTVDDMSWLAKGGRLPKSVGAIGSALKVKPYLTLGEEGIEKKGLVRGQDRVYSRMIKDMKKEIGEFTDQVIAISHVGHEENAKKIQQKIREELPDAKTEIFEIGAVLASHMGIGAIGLFFMKKRPEIYMDIPFLQ